MENKQTIFYNFKVLFRYLAPYKWKFILAILCSIIAVCSITLAPYVEGMITTSIANDVANTAPNIVINFHKMAKLMVVLLGIYLVKTSVQAYSLIVLTNAIQASIQHLRNDLMAKIRRLPIAYFDQHVYGDLLSRISNDVDSVSICLQQSFMNVINAFFTLLFAISMMFYLNVTMACVACLIIPSCLLITKFMVKVSQGRFQAQQEALGDLNGAITELYTGYKEIVLYNRQEESIKQFKVLNEQLATHACKAQFLSSLINPFTSLITYLSICVIAILGTTYVLQGTFLIGNLQAFIRYVWQVNDPLSQISALSSQIQAAIAAMRRIVELLNEEEEGEATSTTSLKEVRDGVVFDHVSFGYGDQEVIHDLNLHVNKGDMVAIVGPTGAGKTTIINLLLRFYEPKKGRILIDGVDISTLHREALRDLFGLVLQDTWLFSGTIYDNIRYGRLDARNDEVIDAAKLANVDHFIKTLPHGYDFVINEEVDNISQGEKQLLTIARAILKNPEILILDEATSSIDTRLEALLQEAMNNVMRNRTSFVIAHRLSTIKKADLILVLQDGDIVEQGTHEQLLKQQGVYANLYESQFSHRKEE